MASDLPERKALRPVHPRLVHVPIGAKVAAAAFDVISAAGGGTHPWARDLFRAGAFVLMIGTGSMFAAAIAGMVDRARWTAPSSRTRRQANWHAAVMSALAVLCVVEIVLRRGSYADAKSSPAVIVVLGLAALVLVVVGGELGGRLVYRGGVGVRAAAEESAQASRRPVV
jgi:uncharacterized membrane protein